MQKRQWLIAASLALAATAGFAPAASADNDGLLAALVGAGLGASIGHSLAGRDGAWVGGAVGAATATALTADGGGYRASGYEHPVPYYAGPPAVIYRPRPVYVARPYRVYYRYDGHYWRDGREGREYRGRGRRERDDD